MRVAKRAWPDLSNHNLGGLAQYLGIAHKHHKALSDARAAGWVIVKVIDHTGLSLSDWLAPPRKAAPAPNATRLGPQVGERVVIAGEPRHGRLAHILAAYGARIMSAVGTTTSLVVVAGNGLIQRWTDPGWQLAKARDLSRSSGSSVRIVAEEAMLASIAAAST